jgi:hypothetical protein
MSAARDNASTLPTEVPPNFIVNLFIPYPSPQKIPYAPADTHKQAELLARSKKKTPPWSGGVRFSFRYAEIPTTAILTERFSGYAYP